MDAWMDTVLRCNWYLGWISPRQEELFLGNRAYSPKGFWCTSSYCLQDCSPPDWSLLLSIFRNVWLQAQIYIVSLPTLNFLDVHPNHGQQALLVLSYAEQQEHRQAQQQCVARPASNVRCNCSSAMAVGPLAVHDHEPENWWWLQCWGCSMNAACMHRLWIS